MQLFLYIYINKIIILSSLACFCQFSYFRKQQQTNKQTNKQTTITIIILKLKPKKQKINAKKHILNINQVFPRAGGAAANAYAADERVDIAECARGLKIRPTKVCVMDETQHAFLPCSSDVLIGSCALRL